MPISSNPGTISGRIPEDDTKGAAVSTARSTPLVISACGAIDFSLGSEGARLCPSGLAEIRGLRVQTVRPELGIAVTNEVQVHHNMVDAEEQGYAWVLRRVTGGDLA